LNHFCLSTQTKLEEVSELITEATNYGGKHRNSSIYDKRALEIMCYLVMILTGGDETGWNLLGYNGGEVMKT